jgi:hypothetical protein
VEQEVNMQSGRNVKERQKMAGIISNSRNSHPIRKQAPRGRWAGGVLVVLVVALVVGLVGTRAAAAEGGKTAEASHVSDAQLLSTLASAPDSKTASPQEAAATGASNNAPLTLTLQDALDRAEKYSPQFQAAVTATKMARANVVQVRSTFLPSVDTTTQELLTQGNGVVPSGRYVTNDGVHVYRAWGVFHQNFSADTFTLASYRAATAGQEMARAQQEIAQRGLKVTVTQAYYALLVAERGYGTTGFNPDRAVSENQSGTGTGRRDCPQRRDQFPDSVQPGPAGPSGSHHGDGECAPGAGSNAVP